MADPSGAAQPAPRRQRPPSSENWARICRRCLRIIELTASAVIPRYSAISACDLPSAVAWNMYRSRASMVGGSARAIVSRCTAVSSGSGARGARCWSSDSEMSSVGVSRVASDLRYLRYSWANEYLQALMK